MKFEFLKDYDLTEVAKKLEKEPYSIISAVLCNSSPKIVSGILDNYDTQMKYEIIYRMLKTTHINEIALDIIASEISKITEKRINVKDLISNLNCDLKDVIKKIEVHDSKVANELSNLIKV